MCADSNLKRPGESRRQRIEGKILVGRVGLEIPTRLPYEKWREAGTRISRIADSFAWCIGDWLAYGQQMYGDRHRRAIELAGLDYQTLRNYAWVARCFEMHRRRERLSFQHHAEVAALPENEQNRWLDLAQEHRWSRNQLRKSLRESRDRRLSPSALLSQLNVPSDRLERWSRAAEKACGRLEPWLIATLDRAADEVLGETE